MAKASAVREAKKAERTPFSSPAANEDVEIIIPEGAESGLIPAGDQYIGRCLGFVHEESKSSGNPMLTWTFTMHEGDYKGMDFTLWTTLTENSMWKMSDVLTALGIEWEPGVPLRINTKMVAGRLVRMSIVDDKFEGRSRSKLKSILPHPDGAGTMAKGKGFTVPSKVDDDEEEEVPRRGRKAAVEVEDEEEEQSVRGRKRAVVEDEEEEDDPPVRKRGQKSATEELEERWPTKSSKRAVRDEEEEEDPAPRRRGRPVVDEDEEEEEERPARKSTKRSRL